MAPLSLELIPAGRLALALAPGSGFGGDITKVIKFNLVQLIRTGKSRAPAASGFS